MTAARWSRRPDRRFLIAAAAGALAAAAAAGAPAAARAAGTSAASSAPAGQTAPKLGGPGVPSPGYPTNYGTSLADGREPTGNSPGGKGWVGRDRDGRLEAFVVAPDGNVSDFFQRRPNGSFSGPSRLSGGPFTGTPAVAPNADGRLEIFALNANTNQVETAYQRTPGGRFTAFGPVGTPGGTAIGAPSAALNGDGRLQAFVRNSAGGVSTISQRSPNGSFLHRAWADLGGQIAGTPQPGIDADGRLEVFARTPDGQVDDYYQRSVGGAFTAPTPVAGFGEAVSDVTAGLTPNGRLEIFARDSDGSVASDAQASPGSRLQRGPTILASIGGTGAPTVTANADGRLEVFATNRGTGISTAYQLHPNDDSYTAPKDLGGRISNTPGPDAVPDAAVRIELLATNDHGQLVDKYQRSPNGAFTGRYSTLGTP